MLTFITFTVKSQNAILWSESSGSSGAAQKTFCATDLIGNIYMASSVDGNGLDWRVVSYRPDSIMRWTYTYNGVGNGDDVVTGIVADSVFGVYVTGTTFEQSDDMSLLALDSAGNMQWIRHYDRANDGSDISTGITESGNFIYVCGYGFMPTTDYDYSILKYDKSGILQWSKHINGTGNGEDRCNAIDVDQNENVYVTGNASVPGGYVTTTDILTVKLNSSGAVQWSNYYGMKPGQNDFGNALTADANGQVYVTGQSYVGTTNSDLVLLKYNAATGAQRWVTRYNGVYSGIELGSGIITAANNSVYVIGSTQNAYGNFDFLTIHYLPNGKVAWTQIYDGPVGGADEGRVILEDGDDVVVSGRSMGTKNFDVTTISYSKQTGNINWTIRYDATFGEAEDVASLARDEMGNVLVGCYSQSGVFTYQPDLIKIHQRVKNELAIERNLEVLSTGFSAMIADSVFKRILWDNIIRAYYDSIYVLYADQARLLGDAAGGQVTQKINLSISNSFSWNPEFNWFEIKRKQMWNRFGKVEPFLGIPKLFQFTKSEFVSAVTNAGFTHTQRDYPIPCTTSEEYLLTTGDLVGKAAWVFFVNIPPFIFYPEKQFKPIVNCVLGSSLNYPLACEICPISSVGSFPVIGYAGTDHHELGVVVNLRDFNYNCSDFIFDANTQDEMIVDISDMQPYHYGLITALPGVYWHRTAPGSGYRTVIRSYGGHLIDQRSDYPDANSPFQTSNTVTLCSFHPAEFHEYGEQTYRYWIDMGGIYKIWSPLIPTVAPMYVYLPPFYGLTYTGAPDMNVSFGAYDNQNTCANGNFQFAVQHEIWRSIPGSTSGQSLGFTNPYDMYTTSDLSLLTNYWMDNAIVVGLAENMDGSANMNFAEFFADNLGMTCDPTELNISGLLGQCESFAGNEFEIVNSLNVPVNNGDVVLIHVEATYKNGETINQCQYLTVNQPAPFNSVSAVQVMIRGDISDYSNSPINYRIRVYSTMP